MTAFDINTLQLSESIHLFKGCLPLERKETHDIVHWILSTIPARDEHKICLLTGSAGQGKTVVLQNLLKEMEQYEKFPVYALKADLVDFNSIHPEEFVKYYADEFKRASDGGLWPVLVIDQIDALSKTLSADRKPINLLDKLISSVNQAANACVVISCRPYDLEYDPLLSKYKYKKKIALENLSTEQVNGVLKEFGMKGYAEGSKIMQFLSVPINLEFFLEYGRDDEDNISLQSLMDTLWKTKISHVADRSKRVSTSSLTKCLESITNILNNSSSLACSRKRLDDMYSKELDYLVSENILVSHSKLDTVSFAHQSLADYVSARLLVQSGTKMSGMLESEHQGLYIRNMVKQYFTYIREADEEQYIEETRNIICDRSGKYRMHIKMLILTTMASWDSPLESEKYFVGKYVLPDHIYRDIFIEAVTKGRWFGFITANSTIMKGLKQMDANVIQNILRVCENVMLYDGETVAQYLLSQIRKDDVEWNRQWMLVVEHNANDNIVKRMKPLFEQSAGDRPFFYENYLQHLASVDYGYVEEYILRYVKSEIERQQTEKKDDNCYLFSITYVDNDVHSLLEHLFETDKKKGAATYLKLIRLIDDVSKYESDDDFRHQESSAYFSYSSSSYYNHHETLVADYLTYAKEVVAENKERIREALQGCLDDHRSIIYYIGICICRFNPMCFKDEVLKILTDKNRLEELDSKTNYQLTMLLEEIFPQLSEKEKNTVLDTISEVAPKWEKTPMPDLRKYQIPLYHIGRRKQELLTAIPREYLHEHRHEEWQYLERMERELRKAEIHEPYKMHSKSGWGAHSLEAMKSMKADDMLKSFRKYNTNSPGFDEKPTRQGECMNFQEVVTGNPQKYIKVIERIIEDDSIHREYAAYGIIGLMKANYDVKKIANLEDRLIIELMKNLTDKENYYALMDVLREIDFFINKGEVTDTMMGLMCRIVKNYPEEHYKDDNLETRQDVYNTGINRARGNAAFHLVKCYRMAQYKDQIFEALESCIDASPATKGAIILQQALLNHLDVQRNFKLYMSMVKDKTPSLVCVPLNDLHPLVYFINTNFDDLKVFFEELYDVDESHEMLTQILWIAWVRGRKGAEQLLKGLLMRSDKAKVYIIRYFSEELVTDYLPYVKPVIEWCADSDDEEVGKVFDYLINDIEGLDWEDVKWYVDYYTKSKVFAYANNQFLEFTKEKSSDYPEDVLRWMCAFATTEHKLDNKVFMSSKTLSNIVAAYNAIRKYSKTNPLLEKALDTMDNLMTQQQVRRGISHFMYQLDNK